MRETSLLITNVHSGLGGAYEGYTWVYHLTKLDFEGQDDYILLGNFKRGNMRFKMFALKRVEPLPDIPHLKNLAAELALYLDKPFVKTDAKS